MKNRIIKNILALLLFFVAMPMVAQDCMEIHLKDGTIQRFYLEGVKEITTSQYDADGQKHSGYDYQHITTNNDNYVFPLIEIDYVSFSKFYENIVKDDFYSAMSQTLPLLADCETVQDAEYKLNFINQAEGVEKAWTNGNCLYVKIKEWETISFHFSHNDNNDAYSSSSHIKSYIPKLKRISEQNNGNLSIVVANQMHNDMARSGQKNLLMALCNDLSNSGLNAHYEDKPSWDFFKTKMYDYDIVFLMTHGGYYNGLHSFITCDELGKVLKTDKDGISKSTSDYWFKLMNKYIEDTKGLGYAAINFAYVDELRPLPHWVGYLQMDERYFGNIWLGGSSEGTFRPNSIFFNGACHSMDGNGENWHSLADKLIDNHGLGLYFGYSNANYYSEKAGDAFFRSMYKGYSTNRAFSDLSESYKVESDKEGAVLRGWPEKGKGSLFLFPTVTKQIEQTTAQNAFNSSGYVEVEGNTTCIDPDANDAVEMGFQYSTNENFSPASSVVSSDVIKLSKPLDNGNGNVQFRAKLTGLQPGNTYFYRAYTYDGLNYNYGEPCSFEIEESSGGIVAYTSCPDSHHPHLIDLGLPSGTKWACCNVGASAPERYGSYYAWGETTEKSSYTEKNYLDGKGTSYDIGTDIAGTQYDAATTNWGSPWVMPNLEQCLELVKNCTSGWSTENGVNGRRFTGPNGAAIFLPYAGYRWDDDLDDAGSYGFYWSSTLYEPNSAFGCFLDFSNTHLYVYSDRTRDYGRSVRPVMSDAPVYPDLQVSQTQVNIDKGSSTTVEITSGSGEYGVTNLNSSIARGTLQGTTITISALAEGDAKVVATDMQSGQKIIIEITVTIGGDIVAYTSCPDSHHPHLIDLGLPSGTKWACCNVGAEKPEDYGGYFAWGETTEKSYYDWSTYIHCDGSEETCHDIGKDIAGTQYDAATANWGSPWVMPNKEQMEELKNCASEWTTENGVYGRRFTASNGASIFLPAAGFRWEDYLLYAGSYGEYWSSKLYESSTSNAWFLHFDSGDVGTYYHERYYGRSVRPVRKN